ncbi:MAG: DUF5412 domain-containing protein [Oscillospiraceae bacterium]|nr:DUF5412 domain-containing protein [Oscillospiraceae bacterium]
MKKVITVTAWIMFFFLLFLPAGRLLCSVVGYRLKLISYPVFAVIPALCGILELTLIHKAEDISDRKAVRILFLLSVPLSLIGTVFYLILDGGFWTAGSCMASVLVCFFLALVHVPKSKGKKISIIASIALAGPVGFLCFISLVFGNIGEVTVIRSVDSPTGSYRASIIDVDEGALGGSTVVSVTRTGAFFDAGLFRIDPLSKEVYVGKWGEFEAMELEWIDDGSLSINGIAYPIE